MIIRNKFNGYVNGNNRLYPGGGGGPTTTKSETSNIPEYGQPYVERMLGATEKQIYTYGPKGQITGFQPYRPFKGETVAGFTPMQKQAMQGIGSYQLPGQTEAATQMTGYAGLGSMGAGEQYARQATDPYAMGAYMSPYIENALAPQMREAARQSAIQGQQQAAQAVQAGAFGGSRFGLMEAERQRNLGQLQSDIYGKGMQSAFEQARQAQQFGSELGLRGYGQGLQAAGQLGALGQQQYGQEMGLLGQQMEIGSKQQAYEQARLNQKIQDYATAQQYPFIQLGTLSNMLRGLPMQASTTQMYQAQPPFMQQAVGLAGAGANLYQAMKAEGGEIKEMASGGIATGADPYKLPSMMKKLSDDQLEGKLGGDTDPETMGIAQAEKQRRDQIRGGMPKMAGGGAVAFAAGSKDAVNIEDTEWAEGKKKEEKKSEVKKTPPPKALPAPATPYQDQARAAVDALSVEPPEVGKLRETVKGLEKRTAGGVEGEMDRQLELFKRFGIDPAKLIEEERAKQRQELAMNEEDYRRSQHLRYAQMFARFGATPGPVLKAALTSINEVVPDLLQDKDKANAVRRDIKKAMYELDKQEYLEKKGDVLKAAEAHEKAVSQITTLNMSLAKDAREILFGKAKIIGGLAEKEIEGQTKIKAEQIQAASRQSSDQRAERENRRREDAQTVNAQKALQNFDNNKTRIERREEAERAIRALANKPDNPRYIQAKRDLDAINAERQAYIANLPAMYPLARLGDLADQGGKETPRSAPEPTPEDIAYTAKKHGISEDEVKKRLGIK